MTTHESFKRRVRARMARTGERYTAARRMLLQQSDGPAEQPAGSGRTWVARPETSDEALRAATGRGWDDWCDLLDEWPGDVEDHSALAAHVREGHGIDGWWAQTVAVGYERITGLRLPYQQPDGTFRAGKSATITVDAVALRELLLDDDGRDDLFPGMQPQLRSRPGSKNPRIGLVSGTVEFSIESREDGRARVTVTHDRLPAFDDVAVWKDFWSDWLAALDEG